MRGAAGAPSKSTVARAAQLLAPSPQARGRVSRDGLAANSTSAPSPKIDMSSYPLLRMDEVKLVERAQLAQAMTDLRGLIADLDSERGVDQPFGALDQYARKQMDMMDQRLRSPPPLFVQRSSAAATAPVRDSISDDGAAMRPTSVESAASERSASSSRRRPTSAASNSSSSESQPQPPKPKPRRRRTVRGASDPNVCGTAGTSMEDRARKYALERRRKERAKEELIALQKVQKLQAMEEKREARAAALAEARRRAPARTRAAPNPRATPATSAAPRRARPSRDVHSRSETVVMPKPKPKRQSKHRQQMAVDAKAKPTRRRRTPEVVSQPEQQPVRESTSVLVSESTSDQEDSQQTEEQADEQVDELEADPDREPTKVERQPMLEMEMEMDDNDAAFEALYAPSPLAEDEIDDDEAFAALMSPNSAALARGQKAFFGDESDDDEVDSRAQLSGAVNEAAAEVAIEGAVGVGTEGTGAEVEADVEAEAEAEAAAPIAEASTIPVVAVRKAEEAIAAPFPSATCTSPPKSLVHSPRSSPASTVALEKLAQREIVSEREAGVDPFSSSTNAASEAHAEAVAEPEPEAEREAASPPEPTPEAATPEAEEEAEIEAAAAAPEPTAELQVQSVAIAEPHIGPPSAAVAALAVLKRRSPVPAGAPRAVEEASLPSFDDGDFLSMLMDERTTALREEHGADAATMKQTGHYDDDDEHIFLSAAAAAAEEEEEDAAGGTSFWFHSSEPDYSVAGDDEVMREEWRAEDNAAEEDDYDEEEEEAAAVDAVAAVVADQLYEQQSFTPDFAASPSAKGATTPARKRTPLKKQLAKRFTKFGEAFALYNSARVKGPKGAPSFKLETSLSDMIEATTQWNDSASSAGRAPNAMFYCSARGHASQNAEVEAIVRDALAFKSSAEPTSSWTRISARQHHLWNMMWTWSQPKGFEWSQLLRWQRVNHFPSTKVLTCKDLLKKQLARVQGLNTTMKRAFHIMPKTFVLPDEFMKFVASHRAHTKDDGSPNLWIMKPIGLSRGRGIRLVSSVADVTYAEVCVMTIHTFIHTYIHHGERV